MNNKNKGTARAGEKDVGTSHSGQGSIPRRPTRTYSSPLRILIVLGVSIFAAEACVMILLSFLPPLSLGLEAFLDAFVLTVLVFPVLYLFSFRPLLLDILERKRAEDALQQSEEWYRLNFENVNDIVYSIDRDFRVTSISPSVEAALGYRPEEIIGHRMDELDLLPPEYHERAFTNTKRILAGELLGITQYEFIAKDGTRRFSENSAVPLIKDREVVAIVSVARDITDRKRMEAELLQYQEQLRSLASELSLAEERERRRISAQLHDHVGQTLVASKAKLGIVRDSTSSDDHVRSIDEIIQMVDQAIHDVRSLTTEISPPELYMLGLEPAVEWLVVQKSEQYGIEPEFEDDGQPKPLDDDVRVLLFQAVRELLMNVVKHSQASTVKVAIRRRGDDIELIVEDDGVGFDTSKLGFQKDKTGGYGLFSVRERLSSLGGSCKIISEPGRGTLVTLAAPLKVDEETTGSK